MVKGKHDAYFLVVGPDVPLGKVVRGRPPTCRSKKKTEIGRLEKERTRPKSKYFIEDGCWWYVEKTRDAALLAASYPLGKNRIERVSVDKMKRTTKFG